ESVRLKAEAHFSDGSHRDVTAWTVFTTHDPVAVDLDASGSLAVLRPGQHIVLARFLDRVVAVRLTVPLGEKALDLRQRERRNFIDDDIQSRLATLRLAPAPLCDDATFLRRVCLDLTGTLPSPEQVREFLDDGHSDRRERVVERLLASQDFVDFWSLKWEN